VLESKLLRRIYGPKRKKVRAGWGNSHNEEHSILYSLPNIIKGDQMKNKMGGVM
jgi:hypothetical protein